MKQKNKIFSLRTKIEATIVAAILITITIGSVFADVQRTIKNNKETISNGTYYYEGNYDFITGSHFNLTNKIYNSKGHIWNTSGANLQLAIYDLENKTGTVYLPAGVITFTSSSGTPTRALNLGSNMILHGAGMNSTILKLGSGVDADYFIRTSGKHNWTIRDLSIDCNAWGGITDNDIGLSIDTSKDFTVKNIHVFNTSSSGIGIDTCSRGKLNCLFIDDVDDWDNTGYGVGHTAQPIAGGTNTYMILDDIHIRSNGTNATTYYTWGLDINAWSWCEFNNIYISGTGAGFKTINTCHNLTFNNIQMRNLTNNGSVSGYQMPAIELGLGGGNTRDCTFNNIHIEESWRAIQVDTGGQRISFNNINIHPSTRNPETGSQGFYISGDFIAINNAHIYNITGLGLYLYGCDDSKFSNIEINECEGAIYMENGDRNSFVNCKLTNSYGGSYGYGILAKTSTFWTVLGCQFISNNLDGIDTTVASCNNYSIANCLFTGNAKAIDTHASDNYHNIIGNICQLADIIDLSGSVDNTTSYCNKYNNVASITWA